MISLFDKKPGTGKGTTSQPAGWLDTEPWVIYGHRLVTWGLGGALVLITVLSVSGAVIATGRVNVEGNYKTIQHLDGGIVAKIHVKNGDRVAEGDVLIDLDKTQLAASLAVARGRVIDLSIQKARLEAERDDRAEFTPPPAEGAEAAAIAAAQTQLFNARRTRQLGQRSVLAQRKSQLDDEIGGLTSQLTSTSRQREINDRELKTVLPLFEKGFVNQQRIAPLEREAARLEGEVGRLKAEIARVKNGIGETDLQIAQVEKEYQSQVADELRQVERTLAEQTETERALADRVARTEIRAPVAGIVHALTAHTEGGVVTAASPIMQIIPADAALVVAAEIAPQSIDKVHKGQAAEVRFPAFDAHTTPRLEGTVRKVSPAEVQNSEGSTYFTAEIEVPPTEIARLGRDHSLVPGMPAEVFIETKSRSILSYLMKPITDMLSRAFRES
ncbi:MAG: HlyD family type I secretion periplasmic adaptor subunit [Hyphomicrobium sp.]|nr:HlyD family type I secretion periplasmic adaptor subunit [Hyphomicrobium sp.]